MKYLEGTLMNLVLKDLDLFYIMKITEQNSQGSLRLASQMSSLYSAIKKSQPELGTTQIHPLLILYNITHKLIMKLLDNIKP